MAAVVIDHYQIDSCPVAGEWLNNQTSPPNTHFQAADDNNHANLMLRYVWVAN